jgi:hypothetical protein
MSLFPKWQLGLQVNEAEGEASEDLHYDLPVILKGRKKERQDRLCEDWDGLIRILQEQPTKMLLSAYLISIENEQCLGENG